MKEMDDLIPTELEAFGSKIAELYGEADPEKPDDPGTDLVEIPLFTALSRIRNRYENPSLLGRGGMKEVYRVYDAYAARDVAMALPKAELSKDYYDAFLREAHITARLQHPCIINLFNMGIHEDGRPFFTMELKRGRSLRQVLSELKRGKDRERYSLRSRLFIFLRVCEAIAYAHSQRVVHLDIKPENIQVGEFGEVQVCDWGMGEVIPGKEGESPTEALLDPDLYGGHGESFSGTPAYMSAEQRDPRCPRSMAMDIYSLGCLLGELVTLLPPDQPWDSGHKIDGVLVAIIRKARATEVMDRYASVSELRADVARYLAGYSTSVESHGFAHEAVLFYRRNRVPCLVTFGLLAVLVMAMSLFVAQLHAKQVEADTARRDAENALQQYMATKAESERRLANQVADTVFETDTMSALLYRPVPVRELFQRAVKQLNSVLANHPPAAAKIWSQRFFLYFQAQQFGKALEFPLPQDSEYVDLWPLAQTYRERVNADGYLEADDLIEVIRALGTRRLALIEHMLVLDAQNQRTPADQVRLLEAILQVANSPGWSDGKLEFDNRDGRQAVRFSGSGLNTLVLARGGQKQGALCILKILSPKSLDLRGTTIPSLAELLGLELIELDLRESAITDLRGTAGMRSLHRLIVQKGQYSAGQLSKVPDFIEIVEK